MALIGTINAGTGLTFKNRIINGSFEINQRFSNTNFKYTYSGQSNRYVTDRFNLRTGDGGHTIDIINSTNAPDGFSRSLNVVSNTASTNAAAFDICALDQRIEGLNIVDLAWGTANAKTISLSFWAKSSNTGNFAITVGNQIADQVNYATTYTINTADNWEYKTITIPGPTTGTWHSNTSSSIHVFFGIGSNLASETATTLNTWTVGSGSPRFVTGCQNLPYRAGAYLALTGIQLEVGATATPFERRPYGLELQLCQRYYLLLASGVGLYFSNAYYYAAGTVFGHITLPVTMRTAPTAAITSGTAFYTIYRNSAGDDVNSLSIGYANPQNVTFINNSEVSGTSGDAGGLWTNAAGSFVALQAEL